jgi:chitinase
VHTAVPNTGGSHAHEFTPYIDMAMSQDADLVAISHASGIQNFTLAFMLSSDHGIGWQGAGAITDDTLFNGTTILSQVQAIQAQGGHITISFGGAAGQEAALTAPNAATLQAEYQSVIDRYHVDSIDFDIEGAAVEDQHSITLRDQALVGLQAANPDLKVSFTLPVLPTGLVASGLNVLQSAIHDGVKIDVVNIMAMDYGQGVDNNGQMGLNAINAAVATEGQLHSLGLNVKIGITPMIGVNDVSSEVFTQADAQALVGFAQGDANVVRLSMWSVARDNGNTAGAHYAAPDSSGVAQTPNEYAGILHHFDVTA